jgi:FKBP-type peptidyl-prolyl cis-trans isomerase
MDKFILSFFVFFSFAFSATAQKYKPNKNYQLKSGLSFVIQTKGEGSKPKKGQKIAIHFEGKNESGEVFASTFLSEYPLVFQLGIGQVISAFDEFFLLVNEGTEATLTVPPHLAYGNKSMSKIKPNSTLVYKVKFEKIVIPPVPFNTENKDTIVLESGLKYIEILSTENIKAESFRKIEIQYTGYLENGNIFDSSFDKGVSFKFKLSVGEVIRGFDEGIKYMKVGEKFRFIIPSNLAYGEKGFLPMIAPNTNLIFDVELVSVE